MEKKQTDKSNRAIVNESSAEQRLSADIKTLIGAASNSVPLDELNIIIPVH
jgi:hypothetical protein